MVSVDEERCLDRLRNRLEDVEGIPCMHDSLFYLNGVIGSVITDKERRSQSLCRMCRTFLIYEIFIFY